MNVNKGMEELVFILSSHDQTISTMESCSGGGVSNTITNIEGASKVLKFSAVTYSNEYKIKMGVDEEIIKKYSVYSMETAHEMSKKISEFTNSTYGVGITGKINKSDENNMFGKDNEVFISIYNSKEDKFYDKKLIVTKQSRSENKLIIIESVIELLKNIIA